MNDTAVVTGGSRGIGLAVSQLLAANGYRIAIIYHTRKNEAEKAAESLRERGTDAAAYQCDVSDAAQVGAVSSEILRRFGRVDVLVNNAGIAQIKLFTDTDERDWNRIMGVNAGGVYNMCRAFVPQMISMKKGRIINMSSMWGTSGASCEVIYSASKAAVAGLTKALAKELGPSGITVNCLAPGVIDTEMNAELSDEVRSGLVDEIPLGRFGKAEDVAGAVLFLASDKASYITGQVIGVDGGIL
ncbi:MAG: elongation factor P 5-aminopentanone reductase [Anaerovoracaceae bacterium]|jgi:3-oxoacyl-[acyl-carrier protein] reductase